MTITDICLLFIGLMALLSGARRGFIRSLLGPCAFIIATAAAFLYYALTKNFAISITIGLLGPFVLVLIFKMVLSALTGNAPVDPGPLSGLAGACVTLTWVAVLVLPVIFVLAIMPPIHPLIAAMRKDIRQSWSYTVFKPLNPAEAAISSAPRDPNAVRDLAADKRMQDFIKDPAIAKAIETKDFAALVSNPKFMALSQDPQFIQKIMSAYRQINQTN